MVKIHQFCTEVLGIQDTKLMEHMEKRVTVRTLRKGEELTKSELAKPEMRFLLGGLLRGYYVDCDGKDITDFFAYRSGDFLMGGFDVDTVELIAIEALQDSEIISISLDTVEEIARQYPEMWTVACRLVEKTVQESWRNKIALTRLTAEERYGWFLQTYPGLIDLVKKKYVASFLNIAAQTLSKERQKNREKTPV